MRATERLRWIALERYAIDNDCSLGSAAARAHGKGASAEEHVASCRQLRFEAGVWWGAFEGCFENRDPVTIRYVVSAMAKASAWTRGRSYMICQGYKWPELLGSAIKDCSSQEHLHFTNSFVGDTLGDIAKNYIDSFQPGDR